MPCAVPVIVRVYVPDGVPEPLWPPPPPPPPAPPLPPLVLPDPPQEDRSTERKSMISVPLSFLRFGRQTTQAVSIAARMLAAFRIDGSSVRFGKAISDVVRAVVATVRVKVAD